MKSDKKRIYIIQIALVVFLLFSLIFSNIMTRQVISVILLVFMVICLNMLKTDKTKLINNAQIIALLSAFGIIYVTLLYMIGIFTGFYESPVKLSIWSIINYIIPYIVIIVSSEIIRKSILLKESRKSKIIVLIAMVLLDIILSTNIYNLKTVNDYFVLVVFIIFSSIANNALYNYIVIKYRNHNAIIIYRLITTLYMYFIPITPNIYIFFESIIKMIVPYILYIILENMYNKNNKVVLIQYKSKTIASTIIFSLFIITIIMLVSCKFRFGLLTIGSGSMTGTINKGDIVFYEQYDEKEQIKTGDVIIFRDEDIKVVHRVIDQRILENETRYYTKGDANANNDNGYRVRNDIVGKVKIRIPYLGYLTLWVNNMF